eukprot:1068111-Pyramimonas_sp.AAC.1
MTATGRREGGCFLLWRPGLGKGTLGDKNCDSLSWRSVGRNFDVMRVSVAWGPHPADDDWLASLVAAAGRVSGIPA